MSYHEVTFDKEDKYKVKTKRDIVYDLYFPTDVDRDIAYSIIDNLERQAAEALKAEKIVLLPNIGRVNINKTKTTIKVSATDTQSGINKYMYIVNGSTIEKTSSNIYVYNNKVNEVYVNLFDNVENQNKIKCNIIDENWEITEGRIWFWQ